MNTMLRAGHEVEIFELRPFVGGKVSSWKDKEGNHIEMGLHVFFGCYYNLFGIMERTGSYDLLRMKEHIHTFVNKGGELGALDFRFPVGAPVSGLQAFARTEQLGWGDKAANALRLGTSPIVRALVDFDGGMDMVVQRRPCTGASMARPPERLETASKSEKRPPTTCSPGDDIARPSRHRRDAVYAHRSATSTTSRSPSGSRASVGGAASVDLLSRRVDGVWGRAGRGWSFFRFWAGSGRRPPRRRRLVRPAGGSRGSIDRMWDPIAYALGFIDCDHISARCMLTIFMLFAIRTEASVLRMLDGSPQTYLHDPIVKYLEERGVKINLRTGIRDIVYETDASGKPCKVTGLQVQSELKEFDAVVAAVDLPGAKKLIPEPFRVYPEFDRIYELDAVPIATVQLRFDGPEAASFCPSRGRGDGVFTRPSRRLDAVDASREPWHALAATHSSPTQAGSPSSRTRRK